MHRGPGRRLLTLVLSSCLLIGGGLATVQEVQPFSLSGTTPEERREVLSDARAASGWSYDGRRDIMLACLAFGDSLYMRAQPSSRRIGLMDGCADAASDFVVGMPSFAEAWLVKAKIAADRKDVAELPNAIARSRLSAPHVLWLAGERLRLREKVRSLSAEGDYTSLLDADQGEDIITLMSSNEGSLLLARQYVAEPGFRDRLVSVAEAAPSDQQELLLAHIRAAMSE
jgi:hypothetical protein